MIHRGDDWTMHAGSCLDDWEGMPSLADDSIDVAITDAPYDEHTHSRSRRGKTPAYHEANNPGAAAQFNRARSLGFDALKPEDMAAIAREFARLARRWSLVFCSLEMISDWKAAGEAVGLDYIRTCVWHKIGATPQFTGDRPAVAVEAIVCFHRPGRKKWNGGGKHGIYHHPIVLDRKGLDIRCHTTQKPVSLMMELVADFSNEGELILDPYAGSGSTGVAALAQRRRFEGWELLDGTIPVVTVTDGESETTFPNYVETSCRRLRGQAPIEKLGQLDIFGSNT